MPAKPPPPRHWLTRRQEMIVRRLIAAGATQAEAARAAGVSYSRLRTRMSDQLRDLRVGRGQRTRGGRFEEIPEDEIAARARALRETWTPDRAVEAWNPAWRPAGANFAARDDEGTL